MTNEHQYPEPTDEVKALTADLLDRFASDAEGQPYDDDNPDTWAEADAAEPEVVRLGQARFKIIDADAQALPLAAGAVEDGAPPALCMRVAFDQVAGQPEPCAGQYIALQADKNVTLIFRVWITHADLHDPAAPDFGPDAERDLVLNSLQPGAYRKNDQAWVEQKNGAIVRRLVGYGRLSGFAATHALAELYAASRLYVNFFQPSFKLKSKTRDGARVSKTYHPPATPCDRLLASAAVSEEIKGRLREQFGELDPVLLLRDIRAAQRVLSDMASGQPPQTDGMTSLMPDLSSFLHGLATAWKDGEVRPTHRTKPAAERWWRTRQDPFEHAWPIVEGWLADEPTTTAKEFMDRLARAVPDVYASKAQLRTLQRRIKAWRAEKAKDLILGKLRRSPASMEP